MGSAKDQLFESLERAGFTAEEGAWIGTFDGEQVRCSTYRGRGQSITELILSVPLRRSDDGGAGNAVRIVVRGRTLRDRLGESLGLNGCSVEAAEGLYVEVRPVDEEAAAAILSRPGLDEAMGDLFAAGASRISLLPDLGRLAARVPLDEGRPAPEGELVALLQAARNRLPRFAPELAPDPRHGARAWVALGLGPAAFGMLLAAGDLTTEELYAAALAPSTFGIAAVLALVGTAIVYLTFRRTSTGLRWFTTVMIPGLAFAFATAIALTVRLF